MKAGERKMKKGTKSITGMLLLALAAAIGLTAPGTVKAEETRENDYPITIVGEAGDHGVVTTADGRTAAASGDTVTLIVTADKDYMLGSITAGVGTGAVELIPADEGGMAYQFTMPASEVTVSAVFVSAVGWQIYDGSVYYYTDDGVVTGLCEIDGGQYYFSEEGKMLAGWQSVDGYEYYFDTTDGRMATGWRTIDGAKYYFFSDGTRTSGFQKVNGATYYFTSAGKAVTGWKTISGARYYFASNGKMSKGFTKIGKLTYYFSSAGKLQKNKIVGDGKSGYYYVDSTGVRVTTAEIKLAVKFVRKYTKSGWSNSKKLKACYNALWENYTYKRYYEAPSAKKMPTYANNMLSNKKGNCYRYAAAFAYIARVLGYDSRVAVGKISSSRGGMTPHGWTEVKTGGKWYMCDANMQRNYPKINSYMRTNKNYAYRHTCSERYTMTVKNGTVTWK